MKQITSLTAKSMFATSVQLTFENGKVHMNRVAHHATEKWQMDLKLKDFNKTCGILYLPLSKPDHAPFDHELLGRPWTIWTLWTPELSWIKSLPRTGQMPFLQRAKLALDWVVSKLVAGASFSCSISTVAGSLTNLLSRSPDGLAVTAFWPEHLPTPFAGSVMSDCRKGNQIEN